MTRYLNVYDLSLKKTAILENAHEITETRKLNDLYTLSFKLPDADRKNVECAPFRFVRYGDDGDYYRIISSAHERTETGMITYECEHAIGTLIDDLMFGTETVSNISATAAINFVLGKQRTQRWVLGTNSFQASYEYLWTDENLLNALFSIPKPWTTPYQWMYDFSSFPWRISLRMIDVTKTPDFYLRAKKNLLSSNERRAHMDICTRLYPLGYGEGVNQLTIAPVNNGVPYIQASDAIIAKYGIISRVFVDRSIEDPGLLLARAQANLAQIQEPTLERSFEAVDLYPLTSDPLDKADVGKIARLSEDGTTTYIVETARVLDEAGNLRLRLSTKSSDVANEIAALADRQRIETTYAQGSTQLYAQSISENATATKGAKLAFYLPGEMRHVNKVMARIELKRFRAFNRQTKGGGNSVQTSSSGGGSVTTSTTGGGGDVDSQNNVTVYQTSGASSITSTLSGGGVPNSTEFAQANIQVHEAAGLNVATNTSNISTIEGRTTAANGQIGQHSHNFKVSGGAHYHGGITSKHSHDTGGGWHAHAIHWQYHSHNMEHTHTVAIPGHNHRVSVPAHAHNVSIPAHTHQVSIPVHAHEIEQGIFEYGNPQSAEVWVEGTKRLDIGKSGEFDLTPFILNSSGKIPRGTWIDIEVKPNDLAYVRINLFVQGFIQSRGGGNY